jgi:hypothetical protein
VIKFFGFFLVSILSFNVLATEEATAEKTTYWYFFDWNIDGKASTKYIEIKNEVIQGEYGASISKSSDGNQRIYFSYKKNNDTSCGNKNDVPNTLKIDEQVINVTVWCKKYTDSENKYMEFTPTSMNARNFVIDKFKKSSSVKVDFSPYGYVYISAKGFSREWNSKSGAL